MNEPASGTGHGPWATLSSELVQEICKFLNDASLAAARVVCSQWRAGVGQHVRHVCIQLPGAGPGCAACHATTGGSAMWTECMGYACGPVGLCRLSCSNASSAAPLDARTTTPGSLDEPSDRMGCDAVRATGDSADSCGATNAQSNARYGMEPHGDILPIPPTLLLSALRPPHHHVAPCYGAQASDWSLPACQCRRGWQHGRHGLCQQHGAGAPAGPAAREAAGARAAYPGATQWTIWLPLQTPHHSPTTADGGVCTATTKATAMAEPQATPCTLCSADKQVEAGDASEKHDSGAWLGPDKGGVNTLAAHLPCRPPSMGLGASSLPPFGAAVCAEDAAAETAAALDVLAALQAVLNPELTALGVVGDVLVWLLAAGLPSMAGSGRVLGMIPTLRDEAIEWDAANIRSTEGALKSSRPGSGSGTDPEASARSAVAAGSNAAKDASGGSANAPHTYGLTDGATFAVQRSSGQGQGQRRARAAMGGGASRCTGATRDHPTAAAAATLGPRLCGSCDDEPSHGSGKGGRSNDDGSNQTNGGAVGSATQGVAAPQGFATQAFPALQGDASASMHRAEGFTTEPVQIIVPQLNPASRTGSPARAVAAGRVGPASDVCVAEDTRSFGDSDRGTAASPGHDRGTFAGDDSAPAVAEAAVPPGTASHQQPSLAASPPASGTTAQHMGSSTQVAGGHSGGGSGGFPEAQTLGVGTSADPMACCVLWSRLVMKLHALRDLRLFGLAALPLPPMLAALAALPNLRTLDLRMAASPADVVVDVAGIPGLGPCPSGPPGTRHITDAHLEALGGLPSLTALHLNWVGMVTGAGLSDLRRLTRLRSLCLADALDVAVVRAADLEELFAALPALQALGLGHAPPSQRAPSKGVPGDLSVPNPWGASFLHHLWGLHYIGLQCVNTVDEQLLQGLPQLPKLRMVDLEGLDLSYGAAMSLVSCGAVLGGRLQRLALGACVLYDAHLAAMADLTQLRHLTLEQVDVRTRHVTGWTCLSTLTALTCFEFREWNNPALSVGNLAVLTDDSVAIMAGHWRRLERLVYLGRVQLTQRARGALATLPSLVHLLILGPDGTRCVGTRGPERGSGSALTLRATCLPAGVPTVPPGPAAGVAPRVPSLPSRQVGRKASARLAGFGGRDRTPEGRLGLPQQQPRPQQRQQHRRLSSAAANARGFPAAGRIATDGCRTRIGQPPAAIEGSAVGSTEDPELALPELRRSAAANAAAGSRAALPLAPAMQQQPQPLQLTQLPACRLVHPTAKPVPTGGNGRSQRLALLTRAPSGEKAGAGEAIAADAPHLWPPRGQGTVLEGDDSSDEGPRSGQARRSPRAADGACGRDDSGAQCERGAGGLQVRLLLPHAKLSSCNGYITHSGTPSLNGSQGSEESVNWGGKWHAACAPLATGDSGEDVSSEVDSKAGMPSM